MSFEINKMASPDHPYCGFGGKGIPDRALVGVMGRLLSLAMNFGRFGALSLHHLSQ
jgi:hypothetical protein